MARAFLTLLQHWSVRSCVRPVCAACMAAGHNAFRGSGPNRKPALKGAMTHTGSPDPSIDLVCITSFALTNTFGQSARWHSSCCQRQHWLVVSLLSTQPSYAISMPQRRRRPQHHKRTNRRWPKSTECPLLSESGQTIAMRRMSALCHERTHAPQQKDRYSITSSAVVSSVGGIVRPTLTAGSAARRCRSQSLARRQWRAQACRAACSGRAGNRDSRCRR